MPGSLASDVRKSLVISSNCAAIMADGVEELRIALAERAWDRVEPIREKLLAAVEVYVDSLAAAAKRVDHERG